MSINKTDFSVSIPGLVDEDDDGSIKIQTEGDTPEEQAKDAINAALFVNELRKQQQASSNSAISTTTKGTNNSIS